MHHVARGDGAAVACRVEQQEPAVAVDVLGDPTQRGTTGQLDLDLGTEGDAARPVVGAQPGALGVTAALAPRGLPLGQAAEQGGEHVGAVDDRALVGERRGPRLVRRRGRDVQPDPHDDGGPDGVGDLGEDARRLALPRPEQQVVRPFEPGRDVADRADGVEQGEPGEQRQPGEPRGRHADRTQQHADRDPGARRGHPRAREPAAPGLLVLRHEDGTVGGAVGGRGEEVGIGGARALHDVDVIPPPGERSPQCGCVQRLDGPVHGW